MVTKEWQCASGHEFEAIAPVCPICGRVGRRAFRTPVGISRVRPGAIERSLEVEFSRRGITNYSNKDGLPRATFRGLGTRINADGSVACGYVTAGCVSPVNPFGSGSPLAGLEGQVAMPHFSRGKSVGNDAPNPSGGAALAALTEIVTDNKGNKLSYSAEG